jgi:hypothetical protein
MNRPYAFLINIPQKCYQTNKALPANRFGTWSRVRTTAGRPCNFVADPESSFRLNRPGGYTKLRTNGNGSGAIFYD